MPRSSASHHALAGDAAVATQQLGPTVTRQAVDQRPQPGRGVRAGVLVAGRRLHAHHEAHAGESVRVMHVARPARLLGIVADDRALLVPVERLDRRVDVTDPGLAEQR
jgi:hypothetical protein